MWCDCSVLVKVSWLYTAGSFSLSWEGKEVWHREWMGFRGWVGLVSTCTSRRSGDFFLIFFGRGWSGWTCRGFFSCFFLSLLELRLLGMAVFNLGCVVDDDDDGIFVFLLRK